MNEDPLDPLVPQFAAADAKFAADYQTARIIVDNVGGQPQTKPVPKPMTPTA